MRNFIDYYFEADPTPKDTKKDTKKVSTKIVTKKELLNTLYQNTSEFTKLLNENKSKIGKDKVYTWVNTSKLSENPVELPENDKLLFPLSHWKTLDEIGNVKGLGYAEPYNNNNNFNDAIKSSAIKTSIIEVYIPYRSEPKYHTIRCFNGTFEELLKHI